ncbi:hypothetical protein niasHT_028676 [Heterodera trifolii]|uniref:Uncharacterized protein n=1 Tax=Heterodera trifolii TaxID=157864 RepID=A0ABD2KIV7_9BILA
MVHIVFDPSNAGYDEYMQYGSGAEMEDYFKGASPFQRGYGAQHGAGVGDVFRGIWRFFLPILRRVGTTVGSEALSTGQRVLDSIGNEGLPIKEALENQNGQLVNITAADEEVGPIQMLGHTFIKNMRMSINGREIFNSNSLMAYKTYFSHELSYSTAAKDSHLNAAGQNFIDLSKCYLLTEFRIRKENQNGQLVNITAADEEVGPIQMLGHTFIKNMRMSINGREIFNSNSLMAYKTYFSHELSYSTAAKDSHLNAAGLCFKKEFVYWKQNSSICCKKLLLIYSTSRCI